MKRVYVVGTADTKGEELAYVKARVAEMGLPSLLVDIGTRGPTIKVDVPARDVAAFHPSGPDSVLGTDDRGTAVAAEPSSPPPACGRFPSASRSSWFPLSPPATCPPMST
jgi:uncharacterized protein (UPF0261 family)